MDGKVRWWDDGYFEEHFRGGFDLPQRKEASNQRETQFLCQGAGSVIAYVRGFPLLAGIPRPVPGRLQELMAREVAWIGLTPILPGGI